MAKWHVNSEQYGAFEFQVPPAEGEYGGVKYDPFTRRPKGQERSPYTLDRRFAFVELYNTWTARSWPELPKLGPPTDPQAVEITPGHPVWDEHTARAAIPGARPVAISKSTTPEYAAHMARVFDDAWWKSETDKYERELFIAVRCRLGSQWIQTLDRKVGREARANPDDSLRHAAKLAQHILDALCYAVDCLADGKRVPDGIWHELTQRGGVVSLRPRCNSPDARTLNFGVEGSVPWWVIDGMEPNAMLQRAADSYVGSFFLYLLMVQLRGKGAPRIRRCAIDGCNRVFVGAGRHTVCDKHQAEQPKRLRDRRAEKGKAERAEWTRLRGDLSARRRAFLANRNKTNDARDRFNRACNALHKDGKDPSTVGYDDFLKYWRHSK
jgi:hypothetical protein